MCFLDGGYKDREGNEDVVMERDRYGDRGKVRDREKDKWREGCK